MTLSSVSLSIIIPVYNEEKRLTQTFLAINEFLSTSRFSNVEIIFVDDGSQDDTKQIINKFQPSALIHLLSYPENKGKGYAVAQGMIMAKNDYALICDADMSTSLSELDKFIGLMEAGEGIIIGTRKAPGAIVSKPQSLVRRNLGRCYTFIANTITGLNVSDFTCGFKVFSRQARKLIFPQLTINRWSYDAEILFLAHRNNLNIKEIPVRWHNDEYTRVRLVRDAIRSFTDLIKIRLNH